MLGEGLICGDALFAGVGVEVQSALRFQCRHPEEKLLDKFDVLNQCFHPEVGIVNALNVGMKARLKDEGKC